MFYNSTDIKVAIVSANYLFRVGLQTIIKHIGLQPVYTFHSSIDEYSKSSPEPNVFVIVDCCQIKNAIRKNVTTIKKTDSKTLFVCSELINELENKNFVSISDSETSIIDKLSTFFESDNEHVKPENGGDILSAREIDVLKEVAAGYSNKEIADRLSISIHTVITHRKNITEKLGIKTISGLTVYALINNLITPDQVT